MSIHNVPASFKNLDLPRIGMTPELYFDLYNIVNIFVNAYPELEYNLFDTMYKNRILALLLFYMDTPLETNPLYSRRPTILKSMLLDKILNNDRLYINVEDTIHTIKERVAPVVQLANDEAKARFNSMVYAKPPSGGRRRRTHKKRPTKRRRTHSKKRRSN